MKYYGTIYWLTLVCMVLIAGDLYGSDTDMSTLQTTLKEGKLEAAVRYVNLVNDEHEKKTLAGKALWISAGLGKTDYCKRFLALGADPDYRRGKADIPIIHALEGKHYEAAAFLADNGADLNDNRAAILKAAARMGMIDFVENFSKKIKWYGEHDKNYMLKSAILGGQEKMVRYLLSQGANPYEKLRERHRIFYFAFLSSPGPEQGREGVIKALLDHDVDIDRPDYDAWTPIATAVAIKDHDMVNRLLAAGANPLFNIEKITSISPRTRHRLKELYVRQNMQLSVLQYNRMMELAGTGGNIVETIDSGHPTPLIRAKRLADALNAALNNGNVEMTRRLLTLGASATQAGYEKLAPLYVAIKTKNPDLIKLLIENNAPVNIGTEVRNPFLEAIRSGSHEVLDALLENGKPDLSKLGNGLLESAIFLKDKNMVEALLKAGADPDTPRTLLPVVKYMPGYAQSGELKAIEEILKQAGASQLTREEKEKQRQTTRRGAIPMLAIVSVFGLLLGQAGLRAVLAAVATLKWSQTRGEITTSRVVTQIKKLPRWRLKRYHIPIIKYRYWVDNEEYSGDTVYVGYWKSNIKSWADRAVAKYPKGARVTVYYEPGFPKYAVLEKGKTHPVNLVLTPIFFIGVLCAIALVGMIIFY